MDKTAKLWDVKSGKEIKTLKGHTDLFTSLSFSPDSKTLASASHDNTVKLWNVNTGREIQTLKEDKGNFNSSYIQSLSFSPDGKTLASASSDNTIKLWNFDLDNLLVRGCGLIHYYLQNNRDVSPEDQRLCDDIKR